MKKKRFSQAEIVHVLEQAKAGVPVRELLGRGEARTTASERRRQPASVKG